MTLSPAPPHNQVKKLFTPLMNPILSYLLNKSLSFLLNPQLSLPSYHLNKFL